MDTITGVPTVDANHGKGTTFALRGKLRLAAFGAACLMLFLAVSAMGCADRAYADRAYAESGPCVHVSYQWHKSGTDKVEDYEVFDVAASLDGNRLSAVVMPEAYNLGDDCSWRVMLNFAGGLAAGERDITPEASYEAETGTVVLPASRAGQDVTVVFVMPWNHESHADHGHFNGHDQLAAARGAVREAASGTLSAASLGDLRAGTTYPLTIYSGANGLESDPMVYGADTNVTGAGTVMGYPELDGRYKFYVAFSKDNCELFRIIDAVPGRRGNGGTMYGGTGTPYDYSWAADWQWCVADCVEAVYNTGGMPVPLAGNGSWVRIDSIEGNSLHCTFRIECNNPDGSNAQDIMGSFSFDLPKGALSFQKSSANQTITANNGCYTLEGAVYGVFATEQAASARQAEGALATYVTDASGAWSTGNDYDIGTTYYITELEAPAGYALNEEVLIATVGTDGASSAASSDEPLVGPVSLRIRKTDAETHSGAQGNATLSGGEVTFRYYAGLYDASNLPRTPTRTWVMRTDEEGIASPLQGASMQAGGDDFYRDGAGNVVVPLGTITAVETAPPQGYLLGTPRLYVMQIVEDPRGDGIIVQPVNYASGEAPADASAAIADDVERGALTLVKYSRHLDQTGAAGDASLRGATFEIVNESDAPVIVGGMSHAPGTAVMQITADENGVASTPDRALPFGTYRVRETATSEAGYLFDEQSRRWSAAFTIQADGQRVSLSEKADGISNDEMRGNIALVKVDRDTGKRTPQGDATLAGARYDIINRSAGPVPSPQTGEAVPAGAVVCTIVTDETGYAATDNAEANGWPVPADFNGKALAYGTYEIVEQSPAGGYLVDSSFTATVSERADGQVVRVETSDAVARGQLVVGKVSRENGAHIAQGDTTLEGWSFEVVNASARPVVVDGAEHAAGDVVMTIVTREVDGRFVADTGQGALPFGTYEVHEIQTTRPQDCGYLFDGQSSAWSKTFTISSDGQVVDYSEAPDACANQVVRGDFSLSKVESPSMKRLAGVPFKITSATSGEWHVIVTDANGFASTEADEVAHSVKTNANDNAVGPDGKVDEEKLDPEAGIWFSGSTMATVTPDDGAGALPFDTYLVEELPAAANAGLNLVSLEVTVTRDGKTVELGTVADVKGVQPQIATTLHDADGNKLVAAAPDATLIDTVAFNNLDTTAEYLLVSSLYIVEDGCAGEQVATAETPFTPAMTHGSVEVAFEGVDTTSLPGKGLVCFERLLDASGKQIAAHEDPDDEGQTVSVPSICTTFSDDATGTHTATHEQAGAYELTDTIAFCGLAPRKTYTVTGTLHDRETGQAVIGDNGQPVTASKSFTPASSEGSVGLTFAFTAADIEGSHIVAFESLSQRGVEYAAHADLAAEEQTVHVPAIQTTLVDRASGTHLAACADRVQLVDSVAFENLTPGKTYSLTGTLHFKGTGNPVVDEAGAAITTSVEFAPEAPDGSVEVPFEFDGALAAGEPIVAFERLESEGTEYAAHADIADEGQTVYIPQIGTTLTNAATGGHTALAGQPCTLVDRIAFAGLKPGEEYIARGALYDSDTHEAVTGSDGAPLVTEARFTPGESDGETSVEFELPAGFSGTGIVAFETVSDAGGRTVAFHEDFDDASQTVIMPSIETELSDADGESHIVAATGTYRLVDEITYRGLQTGVEHRAEGRLVDAETGEELRDGRGNAIVGTALFTPLEPNGAVQVAFSFEAKDMPVRAAAFERVYIGESLIARHEDLADESQTVSIPRLGTTAVDAANGKHEAGADASVTIVDEVRYEGLEPGRLYRIRGTLMDKATGEPLRVDGKSVVSTVDFEAATATGSEKVTFAVSGQKLGGKSLVAFEDLHLVDARGGERLIGSHADIDDAGQTVSYHAPTIADVFDKTGYWLLQHWWIAIVGAMALIAAGTLARGRRKPWHPARRRHAAHAERRCCPSAFRHSSS